MFNVKQSLLPYPQRVEMGDACVKIGTLHALDVCLDFPKCEDVLLNEAIRVLKKAFLERACTTLDEGACGAFSIKLCIDPDEGDLATIASDEGYVIRISDAGAVLCGKTAKGVLYAAVTFSQLLHVEGGDVLLPLGRIVDYPTIPNRGVFVECRFGTELMTREDWFRAIDYFEMQKLNQLDVGVYGCWTYQYDDVLAEYLYVPMHKHPELKTPKSERYYSVKDQKWINRENVLPRMFEEDFFGDLIVYGKKKNVTVRPLFNSLGHNSLIPRTYPEVSAKQEDGTPTGFGFCTRNERTYELLFDFYDEIIDRYLTPNGITSISVGLDEVSGAAICHCPKCHGVTHKELMLEHMIRICKHLKSRGMKSIYVFHDMFYHSFHCVDEELKALLIKEGIYDEVVLQWWSYDDPAHLFWDKADGVNSIMRSSIMPFTGYYHWTIPTDSNDNIRACASLARRLGFEAIEAYSSFEYCYDKNYFCLAEAGWNTDAALDKAGFDARYAHFRFPSAPDAANAALELMRDVMIDETKDCYINRACLKLEYYFYCYRKGNPRTLPPFPAVLFDRVIDKERRSYKTYLRRLLTNSKKAIRFFEKESRDIGFFNDVWLLTAKHYYTLADELLSLWRLRDAQKKGSLAPEAAVAELDRLIEQRERLMLLAESVRFPAARATYLRNMSVFRQCYLEMRAHVLKNNRFDLVFEESDLLRLLR
ncbi:MAG: family 20 glycosylhydrolase [Clostridia bacterium]|nr:family 20 glycosylhydrolase [Clostridia bacterium]